MLRFDATNEGEFRSLVQSGAFEESHYLDVKRELGPGAKSNLELARDLASFAIDGGWLIIGVDENKGARMFSLHPVALEGLAERVGQVAASRVSPRLIVRCREIPSESGPGVGYLVIEIPPSPEAPHMVDGRYFGRGDTTRHVLADAEVRRLNDLRLERRARFTERLAAEVDRDPTPPTLRQEAHLFILAIPSAGRPQMLHDALVADGKTLRGWAQTDVLRGRPGSLLEWPLGGPYDPDIGDRLDPATRANGVGLFLWEMGPNRVPRSRGNHPPRERGLLDLEIDDDGAVHVFCAAGTVTQPIGGSAPLRLMITPLVAGLVVRTIRVAVAISDVVPYLGSWDVGVRLTNLRGAVSARRAQDFMSQVVEYTEDGYAASGQFLTEDLRFAERVVATRLCSRLYRGIGEDLDESQ